MSGERIASYVALCVVVLLLNFAWIVGGARLARRLGLSGKWAVYKGQMMIFAPLLILAWLILLTSGAVWR